MIEEFGFDLSIDPNPRFVTVVRRFVETAFDRLLADPEIVFRVSMSAHELLENGAKYSFGSKVLLRVSFQRRDHGAVVCLGLVNETTPEHIARLSEGIKAISTASDPDEHYTALMKKNARLTNESGLGLARIRAEGEMELGLDVNGSTVSIHASTEVRPEALR